MTRRPQRVRSPFGAARAGSSGHGSLVGDNVYGQMESELVSKHE